MMWFLTAIRFLKSNISFLVIFTLLAALAFSQISNANLETQLSESSEQNQRLDSQLALSIQNSNELQSALLTEQLEKQKLIDHFEQRQAALKRFVHESTLSENQSVEKKVTLKNIASEANESDCINSVMPGDVIRLHKHGP